MRISVLHQVLSFLGSGAVFALGDTADEARLSDFDWASITPSRDLAYHDCYGEYRCARLELPLDWLNASDARTVAVAIMKLPAAVPDDDPAFAGPVFTNPGGPGHSGVTFVPRIGRRLQAALDRPGRRHYEVVSFDPRGVGFSTPLADCFRGDLLARDGVALEARGTLGLDGGVESLSYNYAMHEASSKRCMDADQDEPIFEYLSTPSVARDMVEMIDKMDELRKRETAQRGQGWKDLKKRSDDDDVPRLQYIGFSYGTLLGNFFASLFPGRVHRMVLDSVCDADDYVTGPGWLTNLELTDATLDEFFKGCHGAGPGVCALARASDASWEDVGARTWGHIAALGEAPRGAVNADGYNVVVKGKDVRDLIGGFLYSPIVAFKALAQIIDQSIAGNHDVLISLLSSSGMVPSLSKECGLADTTTTTTAASNTTVIAEGAQDAMSAILCTDGEDVSRRDIPYWRRYVSRLTSMSRVWGFRWAELRFPCSSWPFRARWSFRGPFTTPSADAAPPSGRPSAPLLFLANRFDPVTPVSAARAMAARHPGAGVVVQESLGHGVVTGAPSNCTDGILAAYFESGEVPGGETSCEAQCGPWDAVCETAELRSSSFAAQSLEEGLRRLLKFPLSV